MASVRICDALLPALASEFSTTPGGAARVISAFALTYGLLQLLYGPLGDRHGKVRVIGFATLACTVGNVAAALSSSLDGLVASRVVSGAAAAGIIPLTMAWIGDNVPYEGRQEVLARFLGATLLGMISGQWIGGLIADMFGWRTAFAALATLFLVSGVMLTRQTARLAPPAPGPAVGAGRRAWQVLAIPWARAVLLITVIEGALVFGALAFIPNHLHARFGMSMPRAGAVVALYGVGGFIYSRGARVLVRRLGEPGLARLGGICMALAFATIGWAPTWHLALPACLLTGFGFYSLHNTLQTHATQMAPEVRGSAVSLFACLLFIGQSLGVVVDAWFVDRIAASSIFVFSALGLLLLGAAFATLIKRHARRPKVT